MEVRRACASAARIPARASSRTKARRSDGLTSVCAPGVVHGRKARYDIELLQQAANDLIAILIDTQGVEARQDPLQSVFYVVNGLFGEILAMPIETPLVPEELFAVELGSGKWNRIARCWTEQSGGRT